MPNQEVKRVLAVVSDLFFSVKLTDAAKRAGMALEFVKEPENVLEKAQTRPQLIILDLNFESANPLDLIGKLKGNAATKGISIIGYLSHIQGELKQAAQEAGCDMVMARSAFSQNMSQIFKRHAGAL
jgi:PleD family two-component response regulator